MDLKRQDILPEDIDIPEGCANDVLVEL